MSLANEYYRKGEICQELVSLLKNPLVNPFKPFIDG